MFNNKVSIKKVKFINIHNIIIIPIVDVCNDLLWWNNTDYINARYESFIELQILLNNHQSMTLYQAKKLLYQPNNISYNPSNFE